MSRTAEFWGLVTRCLEAGERVFLALVAENTRHSPGTAGARLLLSETGQRAGTVGGGIMEYKLLERAGRILRQGDFTPEIQTLHHSKTAAGDRSGMICAGSQTNLYVLCRPEQDLETARRVASLVGGDCHLPGNEQACARLSITPRGMVVKTSWLDLSRPGATLERRDEGDWCYAEELMNRRRLAILGGGHCALALAGTMRRLGYDVFVFETREQVVGPELHAVARSVRIVDDFRQAGPLVDFPELTLVVVMTTDFPSDVRALAGVIDRPFSFIGAMGAPAKIEKILGSLESEGFSPAEVERIQAPVGLPIPSHTPEEIAISVAAQILSLRGQVERPDASPIR